MKELLQNIGGEKWTYDILERVYFYSNTIKSFVSDKNINCDSAVFYDCYKNKWYSINLDKKIAEKIFKIIETKTKSHKKG